MSENVEQTKIPSLPSRGVSQADTQERVFRTALTSKDYLRLEIEAMDRGLKPYGLVKSVMTLYLHKHLIYLNELPSDLQEKLRAHLKSTQPSRVLF